MAALQKSVDAREGALSAVECLTYKLGRSAIHPVLILNPLMLACIDAFCRLIQKAAIVARISFSSIPYMCSNAQTVQRCAFSNE